jgi:hypothetical protein
LSARRNPFGSSDDDRGVNLRSRLDDRAADALLSGRTVDGEQALSSFVAELLASVPDVAPPPSVRLATMLETGLPASALSARATTSVLARSARVSRFWTSLSLGRIVAVGAAGVLAAVSGGAATNTLPAPAQTAVANVVEAVTPIHVPRPADRTADARLHDRQGTPATDSGKDEPSRTEKTIQDTHADTTSRSDDSHLEDDSHAGSHDGTTSGSESAKTGAPESGSDGGSQSGPSGDEPAPDSGSGDSSDDGSVPGDGEPAP